VGHCRLALDYLKSLKPNGVKKGQYFREQLSGDETIYHTLNFVEAQQNLLNEIGERKYLRTLKQESSKKAAFLIDPPKLPQKPGISPEAIKEIRQRVRERNAIILGIEDRGPSTISELSKLMGMEKSKLLQHLTAMRQLGQVTIINERDNQPVYELTINMPQ
jgi:predicted transcriptional regulator